MNHKPELKQDRGVMENPVDLNGFVIELHQLLDDNPSTFKQFIDEHGYGIHHLGFAVGDRRDAVVGELVGRGYQKRVEHIYEGGSWTIIDSEESLGVNLNIKPEL